MNLRSRCHLLWFSLQCYGGKGHPKHSPMPLGTTTRKRTPLGTKYRQTRDSYQKNSPITVKVPFSFTKRRKSQMKIFKRMRILLRLNRQVPYWLVANSKSPRDKPRNTYSSSPPKMMKRERQTFTSSPLIRQAYLPAVSVFLPGQAKLFTFSLEKANLPCLPNRTVVKEAQTEENARDHSIKSIL